MIGPPPKPQKCGIGGKDDVGTPKDKRDKKIMSLHNLKS